MSALLELAERCEAATRSDNELDVLIECALFKPEDGWVDAQPNSAGTKVIYTHKNGAKFTFSAGNRTLGGTRRAETASALRARASMEDQQHG